MESLLEAVLSGLWRNADGRQALSLPSSPCSMAVVRWPQSLQLKLYERRALRDTLLAQLQLLVPGHAGRPPADAAPVAYEWTSAGSFTPCWAAEGAQVCSQMCVARRYVSAPVVGTQSFCESCLPQDWRLTDMTGPEAVQPASLLHWVHANVGSHAC